jgi:hypothetical protein
MPRPVDPEDSSYCLHKPSNRAYVNGLDKKLGPEERSRPVLAIDVTPLRR